MSLWLKIPLVVCFRASQAMGLRPYRLSRVYVVPSGVREAVEWLVSAADAWQFHLEKDAGGGEGAQADTSTRTPPQGPMEQCY